MVSPVIAGAAASALKKLKLGKLGDVLGFSSKPKKNRRKSLKLAAKKLRKLAKYNPAEAEKWNAIADELVGASKQLRDVNQFKYHQGPRPSWLAGRPQDQLPVPSFEAAPIRAQERNAAIAARGGNAEPQGGFDWGEFAENTIGGAIRGIAEDIGGGSSGSSGAPVYSGGGGFDPGAYAEGGGEAAAPSMLANPAVLVGLAAVALVAVFALRK